MKLNSAYLEDRFDENYSEYTEMFQTLLKPKKNKPDSKKIEPDSDDVDQENYLFKYNIDFIYFSLSLINKYHIHA